MRFQVAVWLVLRHQKTQNPLDSCFSVFCLCSAFLHFLTTLVRSPDPCHMGCKIVVRAYVRTSSHISGQEAEKEKWSYPPVEENSSNDLIDSYYNLLLKCQQHFLISSLLNLNLHQRIPRRYSCKPKLLFNETYFLGLTTRLRVSPENSYIEVLSLRLRVFGSFFF